MSLLLPKRGGSELETFVSSPCRCHVLCLPALTQSSRHDLQEDSGQQEIAVYDACTNLGLTSQSRRRAPVISSNMRSDPSNATLSPNGTLICTVDDTSSDTGILLAPTSESNVSVEIRISWITHSLLRALQARQNTADVVGFFISSLSTSDHIDAALMKLVGIVFPNGINYDKAALRVVLGLILEVRRPASRLVPPNEF